MIAPVRALGISKAEAALLTDERRTQAVRSDLYTVVAPEEMAAIGAESTGDVAVLGRGSPQPTTKAAPPSNAASWSPTGSLPPRWGKVDQPHRNAATNQSPPESPSNKHDSSQRARKLPSVR